MTDQIWSQKSRGSSWLRRARSSGCRRRWLAKSVGPGRNTSLTTESQLALSALALRDQHAAPALAALERLFVSFDRRDLAEALLLLSIGTNSY